MSVISGEQTLFNPLTVFKAIFRFSELVTNGETPVSKGLSDFVAYAGSTGLTGDAVVKDFNFNFADSNCDVNILGISQSSTACLAVYDISNSLNPGNVDSEYYGCLLDGVHVEIYIADTFDDNYDMDDDRHYGWEQYGDWYTTNFEANLSDGGMEPVMVSLEDKVNIIGGSEVTFEDGEEEAIAGLTGVAILRATLNNVKWWDSANMQYRYLQEGVDYVINITDTDDIFGITKGSLVRDVINNVCQTLLARAYVRLDGKLYIEPFDYVHTTNEWLVAGQNSLVSSLTGNNIYSDVCVKYYDRGQLESGQLADVELETLNSTDSVVDKFISFGRNAASIDSVEVKYDITADNQNPEDLMIDEIYYRGWSKGCNVRIALKSSESAYTIEGARLIVKGMVPSGNSLESQHYNINTDTKTATSMTLYYNSNQILSADKADTLAQKIAGYIKTEIYRKSISGAIYSLKMCIGDKFTLTDVGPTFSGTYRIINVAINLGESYGVNLTLTPIEEED